MGVRQPKLTKTNTEKLTPKKTPTLSSDFRKNWGGGSVVSGKEGVLYSCVCSGLMTTVTARRSARE